MNLTEQDVKDLIEWGYEEKDLLQIAETLKKAKLKTDGGNRIKAEEAISILGRERFLSAIARAAFHFSATAISDSGVTVHFDNFRMFHEIFRTSAT